MQIEISERQFELVLNAIAHAKIDEERKAQYVEGKNWELDQKSHLANAAIFKDLLNDLKKYQN